MYTFTNYRRSAVVRTFLAVLPYCLLPTAHCPLFAAQAAPARPNIVVILVDDMGYSDLGCYGSEIPTPNIDGLAADGLRFTQFYNTARCCPTRAALLTGLYSHQAGVGWMTDNLHRPAFEGRLNDRCVTFAEALRPAGYATLMAGKWHVGVQPEELPRRRGFDHFFGSAGGAVYYDAERGVIDEEEWIYPKGAPLPQGFYGADVYTDHAIKFMDEAVANDKPFLLYVAHSTPHFPIQAPEDLIAKNRGKYLAGWDQLRAERYQRQVDMGLVDAKWPLSERPPEVKAWADVAPKQQKRFDHIMSIYAAAVERMDWNIGRLIAALKERGVYDNTVVLFMSDNGGNAESGPRGRLELKPGGERLGGRGSIVFCGKSWATLMNTPFRRYKHFVHEGGISTPLIVRWPAAIGPDRRGTFEKTPAHVIDIMPTCLELAGATYPREHHGKTITPVAGESLVPIFRSGSFERKRPLFWEHEGNRAVRKGRWKLVALGAEGPWELYDIVSDRCEQTNLVAVMPEIVKDLTAEWDAWAKSIEAIPFPQQPPWQKAAPGRKNSSGPLPSAGRAGEGGSAKPKNSKNKPRAAQASS